MHFYIFLKKKLLKYNVLRNLGKNRIFRCFLLIREKNAKIKFLNFVNNLGICKKKKNILYYFFFYKRLFILNLKWKKKLIFVFFLFSEACRVHIVAFLQNFRKLKYEYNNFTFIYQNKIKSSSLKNKGKFFHSNEINLDQKWPNLDMFLFKISYKLKLFHILRI